MKSVKRQVWDQVVRQVEDQVWEWVLALALIGA